MGNVKAFEEAFENFQKDALTMSMSPEDKNAKLLAFQEQAKELSNEAKEPTHQVAPQPKPSLGKKMLHVLETIILMIALMTIALEAEAKKVLDHVAQPKPGARPEEKLQLELEKGGMSPERAQQLTKAAKESGELSKLDQLDQVDLSEMAAKVLGPDPEADLAVNADPAAANTPSPAPTPNPKWTHEAPNFDMPPKSSGALSAGDQDPAAQTMFNPKPCGTGTELRVGGEVD